MDGDPEACRAPRTSQNYSYHETVGNQNKAPFNATLVRKQNMKNLRENMQPNCLQCVENAIQREGLLPAEEPYFKPSSVITDKPNTTNYFCNIER